MKEEEKKKKKNARARPLQRVPRKSGKIRQAESFLQDAGEKPANDVLPSGSIEMQQKQDVFRDWHDMNCRCVEGS